MMQKFYFVYLLKCADNLYYTGITNDLERRLLEHQQGLNKSCFTFKRRPVTLIYQESFTEVRFAIEREKQLKGWSRGKKEALINEQFDQLKKIARSRGTNGS